MKNKSKIRIKVTQIQKRNKTKNRLDSDECLKIIKNWGLTEKFRWGTEI